MQPHQITQESYRTRIARALLTCIVGGFGWWGYTVFQRAQYHATSASCQACLRQIGLGLMQYAQDYNDTLPLVAPQQKLTAKTPYGWADAFQPYVKSTSLLHCPTRTQFIEDTTAQTDPRRRNYTDHWLNGNVSGVSLENIGLPATTLLVGDGNDGHDLTDARYNLRRLPPSWRQDENSPAYRHLGRFNALFLDGHAKALEPRSVVASPHQGPSFALR